MKRVIVTPAGRPRYLDVLYKHLAAQKSSFDEWWLLVNTSDIKSIGFCERLSARNESWIHTKYAEGSRPEEGNMNIHRFLNEFCRDPETVYVRLDDDVVYLCPGFVGDMFRARIEDTKTPVIFANIINNALTSHLHQKFGNIESEKRSSYNYVCPVGWGDPEFAESVHRQFIADPSKWKFTKWILTDRERVSVNAVAWRGDMLKDHSVEPDEEPWLASRFPELMNATNYIHGGPVCVHFAFHTQRQHLDSTDLLDKYAAIADDLSKPPPAPLPAPEPEPKPLPVPEPEPKTPVEPAKDAKDPPAPKAPAQRAKKKLEI